MDAYELSHVRDVREGAITSAADAVQVITAAVPAGRIWTILDITYFPSITETRIVAPYIYSRANVQHVVDYPVSRAINPAAVQCGLIPMGIELRLYPGERLGVWREVATAGSTMTMNYRFIESDLPLYSYTEPQMALRQARARSSVLNAVGGGAIGGGPGSSPGRPGGGPSRPPAY